MLVESSGRVYSNHSTELSCKTPRAVASMRGSPAKSTSTRAPITWLQISCSRYQQCHLRAEPARSCCGAPGERQQAVTVGQPDLAAQGLQNYSAASAGQHCSSVSRPGRKGEAVPDQELVDPGQGLLVPAQQQNGCSWLSRAQYEQACPL